jgi:hypothetical protein
MNENVAYAKSILAKNGINQESPEWPDYVKIREICGDDHGYVGIITRLRFVDGITDMEELKSVKEILKTSKIDVPKLNRMSYDEILNLFYDELTKDTNKKDYEVVFKDTQYTYYRVYTYEGILKTGSPAWCLKTKSNWEQYQKIYSQQWVVVDNRYLGKLLTPDTNYLKEYKSDKGWVRFGISIKFSEDGTSGEWIGFSDSNRSMDLSPKSWTFFGVFNTVVNLSKGIKKSYWEHFPGCEKYPESDTWLRVVDLEKFSVRCRIKKSFYDSISEGKFEVFVKFSKTYTYPPLTILMSNSYIYTFYPFDTGEDSNFTLQYSDISGKQSMKVVEDYARKSESSVYSGIKLKIGQITMDQILSHPDFRIVVGDKWVVFEKKTVYLVVNLKPVSYEVAGVSYDQSKYNMEDPVMFYVNKGSYNILKKFGDGFEKKDFHDSVIEEIRDMERGKIGNTEPEQSHGESPKTRIDPIEPEKKVKGFWSFLKKKNEDVDYDLMSIYRDYDPNRKPKPKPTPELPKFEPEFKKFRPDPKPETPRTIEIPKDNPIKVLSAINRSGNKEIIFTYEENLYKWTTEGGLIDGSTNNPVYNSEIIRFLSEIKDGLNYIEISDTRKK